MIICLCLAVSDRTVHAAIAGGATTIAAVRASCGAGKGCGACLDTVADMLHHSGARCVGAASPYLVAEGATP